MAAMTMPVRSVRVRAGIVECALIVIRPRLGSILQAVRASTSGSIRSVITSRKGFTAGREGERENLFLDNKCELRG
jgi:hypothetical protein